MAGKRISPKKHHWAPFVVILAVAALVATIGGTMAWLTAKSDGDLVNTFTPANIQISIDEDFKNNVKSRVEIVNNDQAKVYIRATLVCNWVNGDSVCADASHAHDDSLDFTLGSDWVKNTQDGYYYYTKVVDISGRTSNLLGSGLTLTDSHDCKQQVIVLAQAIQAEGVGKDENNAEKKPVELAWGVDPTTLGSN